MQRVRRARRARGGGARGCAEGAQRVADAVPMRCQGVAGGRQGGGRGAAGLPLLRLVALAQPRVERRVERWPEGAHGGVVRDARLLLLLDRRGELLLLRQQLLQHLRHCGGRGAAAAALRDHLLHLVHLRRGHLLRRRWHRAARRLRHRRTLWRRLRRRLRLRRRRLRQRRLGRHRRRGRGGRLPRKERPPRDEPLQVLQLRLELLCLRAVLLACRGGRVGRRRGRRDGAGGAAGGVGAAGGGERRAACELRARVDCVALHGCGCDTEDLKGVAARVCGEAEERRGGREDGERAEGAVGAAPCERDSEQLGGVVGGAGAVAEQQHPVRGLVDGAEVAAAVGVARRGAAQLQRVQRARRVDVAVVAAARVPQLELEVAVGAREQQVVGAREGQQRDRAHVSGEAAGVCGDAGCVWRGWMGGGRGAGLAGGGG